MNKQKKIKIVLLGESNSGKTCLIQRFIHATFGAFNKMTLGASFLSKSVIVSSQSFDLCIWDTAGQERFATLNNLYYREAHAAILCYDLTDLRSWNNVSGWVKKVRDVEKACRIYLCGTKLDLLEDGERPIRYQNTKDYAHVINANLFETSSKTGENVDELFCQIAQDVVAAGGLDVMSNDCGNIRLENSRENQSMLKRFKIVCCGN